jgi:hypothetical protein
MKQHSLGSLRDACTPPLSQSNSAISISGFEGTVVQKRLPFFPRAENERIAPNKSTHAGAFLVTSRRMRMHAQSTQIDSSRFERNKTCCRILGVLLPNNPLEAGAAYFYIRARIKLYTCKSAKREGQSVNKLLSSINTARVDFSSRLSPNHERAQIYLLRYF